MFSEGKGGLPPLIFVLLCYVNYTLVKTLYYHLRYSASRLKDKPTHQSSDILSHWRID